MQIIAFLHEKCQKELFWHFNFSIITSSTDSKNADQMWIQIENPARNKNQHFSGGPCSTCRSNPVHKKARTFWFGLVKLSNEKKGKT